MDVTFVSPGAGELVPTLEIQLRAATDRETLFSTNLPDLMFRRLVLPCQMGIDIVTCRADAKAKKAQQFDALKSAEALGDYDFLMAQVTKDLLRP
eukprot:4014835-Amphidinium_carterae.1